MRNQKWQLLFIYLVVLVVIGAIIRQIWGFKGVERIFSIPTTQAKELPLESQISVLGEKVFAIQLLVYYSQKYSVDAGLVYRIIDCESGFDLYARNPSSTAKSYFQFLSSTWKSTMKRMKEPENSSVFDPENQIKAGIWLLSKDGTRHWLASQSCWKINKLAEK